MQSGLSLLVYTIMSKKHGMYKTSIYRVWQSMKQRCYDKNYNNYKDWGGRGIKVCDRWLNFLDFYEDMGDRPIGKSLDRIDNNGNYCKENCRWVFPKQQSRNIRTNRIITYKGKTMCMIEWAEEFNINYDTLQSRLRAGWGLEKSFNTPTRKLLKNLHNK